MSWTKEDSARLRELHTACMTVSEIAETMGKPAGWIRTELKEMGYKPIEKHPEPEKSEFGGKTIKIPQKKSYTKITREIEKMCCQLRNEGKSISAIATELGIGTTSVGRIFAKHREDKPMKVNKDFDDAVSEMIAEAKEKEPASAATDTSSVTKEVNSLSQDSNTTEPPESQAPALTGIKMMMEVEAMLSEVFGRDAEIIDINANGDHCDIGFTYHGREYSMLFAEREEVPSYGNDKH